MAFQWETIIYKAYSPPTDPKNPPTAPTIRDHHRMYGPATAVRPGYFGQPGASASEFHWLCSFKTPPPAPVLRDLADQMAGEMTKALRGSARVGSAYIDDTQNLYYVDFAVDDAELPPAK
jgi:hypothetical protein